MSQITTRKKLDISTFHAHAGIKRSTIEGDPASTSNKTLRTDDIDQLALNAAIESYTYSELPPPDPTPTELAETSARDEIVAKLDEIQTNLTTNWASLDAAGKTAALRAAGILCVKVTRYIAKRFLNV